MFRQDPLPASGPVVYHPGSAAAAPTPPAFRPLSLDEVAAARAPAEPLPGVSRGRRRGLLLTVLVSVAAMASFGGVVYWAHKQDIERGGSGVTPLIPAPPGPAKIRPDDPKGMSVPNLDKEVYTRVDPKAVAPQSERLLPPPTVPQMPAPRAAAPPAPPTTTVTVPPAGVQPVPSAVAPVPPATPPPTTAIPKPATPPVVAPPVPPTATPKADVVQPTVKDTGGPASIAALIDGMAGPGVVSGGGYRLQLSAERSEDAAKATWARLQKSNADVLGSLRMQAARADLKDKGIWYRVQAGPLDEKSARDACARLKPRGVECILLPPSR